MATAAVMCQLAAEQAVQRGAAVNPDELWSLLELADLHRVRLVVDVDGGSAMQWAWWSTGAEVVAVDQSAAALAERMPDRVSVLHGSAADRSTVGRVRDQLLGRRPDLVVLNPGEVTADAVQRLVDDYAPPGVMVAVQGVARSAGARAWWEHSRDRYEKRVEIVAAVEPFGFAVIRNEGKAHRG